MNSKTYLNLKNRKQKNKKDYKSVDEQNKYGYDIRKKQEQELLDKEQDEKDKQNLLLIKSKATMIYKENIEKNIIDYIIQNNNDNLKYENWLKLFSKSDWVNEFDEKGIHRENKIYHDIWNDITYEENGFVLLY